MRRSAKKIGRYESMSGVKINCEVSGFAAGFVEVKLPSLFLQFDKRSMQGTGLVLSRSPAK